jgi:predicted MFS family arabinose efflux permease
MAMIGASIGLSFALSLVLAPLMVGWGGLSGLFWLITAMGVIAFLVAAWVVPAVPRTPRSNQPPNYRAVLAHRGLMRLNFGVFCLHLTQVSLFVVVPPLLVQLGGIEAQGLWRVYLPVLFVSFLFMVPIIFLTEKKRAHPQTLRWSVAGLTLVGLGLATTGTHWGWLIFWLTGFFVAFNVLEALQPSLVSRAAAAEMKGLALGVYNTTQAMGLFMGGAVGGWLAQNLGQDAVFWAIAGLSALWLVVTWRLTLASLADSPPAHV